MSGPALLTMILGDTTAPGGACTSLACLTQQHLLLPFAIVAQMIVFVLMVGKAVAAGLSQHDEHWGHAAVRPLGFGITSLGLIELCKLASGAFLAGTLSF